MPASRAAAITARLCSSSARAPKLLHPSPTADTDSSPIARVSMGGDSTAGPIGSDQRGGAMESAVKAAGIPATFEPVEWNPPGLPSDADEVIAWIVDPARRGELYPLYHQLRRLAPVHKTGAGAFHG